ncbi:hypothetical protein [Candidatus Epulonipiscium viviparus]|uniref:hypothetical protein n=1 Tax=Candidatus Epulonipiscium viviparus TaxID=420336 RepID=UPI00016BFDAD|nr:hypothetical protein [Candidatus Epulopiscium viviparus]
MKINLKNQKIYILVGGCLIAILLTLGITINFAYKYFNPQLLGEWTSTSTNENIKFEKNGNVRVGTNPKYAYYEILSPTKMLYIVGDISVDMYYELEGRTLYWGESADNIEIFKK